MLFKHMYGLTGFYNRRQLIP